MDEHFDIAEPASLDAERAEAMIVEALAAGRPADLGGATVAGEVLAALIGGLAAETDRLAGGVRIANVVVAGGLDLSRRRLPLSIELVGCRIEGGPLALTDARIDGLAIVGCALAGGLAARRLAIDGALLLDRTTVDGHGMLADARIAGTLSLAGSVLGGGLDISRAWVGGILDATGAAVTASPVAVAAPGLRLDADLLLVAARLAGSLDLDGAAITGALVASRIDIAGGPIAFSAQRARIAGRAALEGARMVGEAVLTDAVIGGDLTLDEARLYGGDKALSASGLSVAGAVRLTKARFEGAADLAHARIAGPLDATGATLKVDRGSALALTDASIGADVVLAAGFHTIGAVRADHASVTGTLDLRGSHLRSAALAPSAGRRAGGAAPANAGADIVALSLSRACVTRLVLPERGDERPRGIVDLSHARCEVLEDYAAAWPPDARQRVRDGGGHDVEHMILDGLVYRLLANPTGRATTGGANVDAARARIAWLGGQRREDLGVTLCRQPWTMLADRLAAQGLSNEADRVTVALRRRERASRAMPAGRRWSSRLADWLMLYGLSPWRSLAVLAAMTLVLSMVWAAAASRCAAPGCLDEHVFVITNKAAYTEPRFERTYPRFNALGYSVDLSLPLVPLGYRDHWRANVAYDPLVSVALPAGVAETVGTSELSITTGGLLFVLALAQQLLGLILSLAVVASLTGITRPRIDR
ncbi:MAG: hypothetical protein R3D27_05335 [Hyphomicrobiaceae bacterium]